MDTNKLISYILYIVLITVGVLIFIGSMLPIGLGTLDFGFLGINLNSGPFITLSYIDVQYNPLLGRFIVDYFNIYEIILTFIGLYDLLYASLYDAMIASPILPGLMVIVLVAGILIALFGVSKLLKDAGVISGADSILGEGSNILAIIFIVLGAAATAVIIIEYILFSTQVIGGIKTLHEMLSLLIDGNIWLEMTTKAKPLAGFYLVLISAIGSVAISIYLIIKEKAPEQRTTTSM